MILYKIGKVVSIGKSYLILESNYTGSIIYIPRPNEFEKNKICKVFIYKYTYDNHVSLYGFRTFRERILFDDLLGVPGIGPKTAIQILKQEVEPIIDLIISADFENLASLPGLGLKSAKQLIFELQEKYQHLRQIDENRGSKFNKQGINGKHNPNKIKNTLKTLGFTSDEINYAISKLTWGQDLESMVEEAIKLISNANQKIIKTN